MGRSTGEQLGREVSMIRSMLVAVRELHWNRDRRRRIDEMRRHEALRYLTAIDCVESMAIQLAEIRGLPEALEPHR
jgi:hypothetical protein